MVRKEQHKKFKRGQHQTRRRASERGVGRWKAGLICAWQKKKRQAVGGPQKVQDEIVESLKKSASKTNRYFGERCPLKEQKKKVKGGRGLGMIKKKFVNKVEKRGVSNKKKKKQQSRGQKSAEGE